MSSLSGEADATSVEATAHEVSGLGEQPTATSEGGSAPFVVVGVAFALGIAAAQWIAWRARR
jgi:hypothetical protein